MYQLRQTPERRSVRKPSSHLSKHSRVCEDFVVCVEMCIFAALAATTALAGCTKEITPPSFENDKVNPAAEGSRVIAVSFAPQTKTTIEGLASDFCICE